VAFQLNVVPGKLPQKLLDEKLLFFPHHFIRTPLNGALSVSGVKNPEFHTHSKT
jgi:hypothetical protein